MMSDELTNKLYEEFEWFRPWYRVECADGWFEVIYKLCKNIQNVLDKEVQKGQPLEDFTVVQVKEKFGGLRFYTHNSIAAIEDLIESAYDEVNEICEYCGDEGVLRKDLGWIRTLCNSCHAEAKKGN